MNRNFCKKGRFQLGVKEILVVSVPFLTDGSVYEDMVIVPMTTAYPAFGDFSISDISEGTYDVALKYYNHVADMVQVLSQDKWKERKNLRRSGGRLHPGFRGDSEAEESDERHRGRAPLRQEEVVDGGDVTGLEFTLWAGDADGDDNPATVYPEDPEGDNDIDLNDYYTLYYQYMGSFPVTAGRNADFDGDGDVDLDDYWGLYYGYQNNPNPGNWYFP